MASNDRPQVSGSLEEAAPQAVPLLVATGQVIFAAAGLERALELELLRLSLVPRDEERGKGRAPRKPRDTRWMTAGALLAELRKNGLATDLHDQIEDAIQRRNDLVHRPVEAVDIARALMDGGPLDEPVGRLNELAIDCGRLATELVLFVWAELQRSLGISVAQMAELATAGGDDSAVTAAQRAVLDVLGGPAEILAKFQVAFPGLLEAAGVQSQEPDAPSTAP